MLGYIRGKYSTIPIPDSDVTLNQSDLISSATDTKNALIERLMNCILFYYHKFLECKEDGKVIFAS